MDFFSKYRPSIIALCEKHKVKRLFAFGSVLTSRFTEKSDIDLVVDFDKEVEQVDYVNNFFDLRDVGCGRCCALCEDHSCEDDYD